MSKKGYLFDKRFLFETREAAEAVLKELRCFRDMYGFVEVDTLYLLMDFDRDDERDKDYVWTDLKRAFVTFTSDGYRLCLPTAKKQEIFCCEDPYEDVIARVAAST